MEIGRYIVDVMVGSVRKSRLVGIPDSSEDKGRLKGFGWIGWEKEEILVTWHGRVGRSDELKKVG